MEIFFRMVAAEILRIIASIIQYLYRSNVMLNCWAHGADLGAWMGKFTLLTDQLRKEPATILFEIASKMPKPNALIRSWILSSMSFFFFHKVRSFCIADIERVLNFY